jgi:hypothetical protein
VTRVERYLSGRVGPFGLLLPAHCVRHVRTVDDWRQLEGRADFVDLRRLFRVDAPLRAVLVGLAADAGGERTILLDFIGQLHSIDDSAFLPLPSAFRYASAAFDAVCDRQIDGFYGLRMRQAPSFTLMSNACS